MRSVGVKFGARIQLKARSALSGAAAIVMVLTLALGASADERWRRGYDECSVPIKINSYTLGHTYHNFWTWPAGVPVVTYKGYGVDTYYQTNTNWTRLQSMEVYASERIYSAWPSC